MTIEIYNNDCLYQMTLIKSKSVDLVFCDLPNGEVSCAGDSKIDLEAFWVEIDRITKPTTPIFFCCSTKYGVELIASNPKNFRYDLVWVKSASCGFLNARKMPMRKHEMLYVFYKKLPYYNLSSHKNMFLDSYVNLPKDISLNCYGERSHDKEYIGKAREANVYTPPLPNSVVKLEELCNYDIALNCYGGGAGGRIKISKNKEDHSIKYDPQLPNSILTIPSEKGKHNTQKPLALVEWVLKYYSKEGDLVLDPTMGSGTTGVACKLMNRKFIGIEKNDAIFKYASERLHKTFAPIKQLVDIAGNNLLGDISPKPPF